MTFNSGLVLTRRGWRKEVHVFGKATNNIEFGNGWRVLITTIKT
jgi:hypothetical protein